jgi:hypothetical protein
MCAGPPERWQSPETAPQVGSAGGARNSAAHNENTFLLSAPQSWWNPEIATQVGSAGGARNSAVYNEKAFLLSARSMVHCTRQPPPDFRPLMQVGRDAQRP